MNLDQFEKKVNKNDKKFKHDFRFEVANLITEARYHYKITQKQLAKKVGTQQPSIARMESGSTLPSLSFLERLADSLGTYLIAPQFGFMIEENRMLEQKNITGSEIKTPYGELIATSPVLESLQNSRSINYY